MITPDELKAAYALSARPYLDVPGGLTAEYLSKRSWRYILEVNSACNLRCTMCMAGNRKGFDYTPGIMKEELMQKVLDKIQSENPQAIVCSYANSEPFLHPRLSHCISEIKKRGFRCELSSNLNYIDNLDGVLESGPDQFIVSLSGFTQEVYEKQHVGGDIEKVKANCRLLAEARDRLGFKNVIAISYHKYQDNLHEFPLIKQFAEELGFYLIETWARAITIEPTIRALRFLESYRDGKPVKPFETGPDGKDWNKLLPPADPVFIKNMQKLKVHPEQGVELYKRWPVSPVCLISEVFTYIRHDGRVQLCPWTDDMRLTLGNYLEMTNEQMAAARFGNPVCKECLKYRLNNYFHIADMESWNTVTPKEDPFLCNACI